MLGVVGLVIGEIWVAASAIHNRWFESEFNKGLLVLYQNSQKYFSQNDACDYAYFHYGRPEILPIIYPKEWTNANVAEKVGEQAFLIICDGDGNKILKYQFSKSSYVCNALVPKINAQCAQLGCSIPNPSYFCGRADGEEMELLFPLPLHN